jgi:hypothetical protein
MDAPCLTLNMFMWHAVQVTVPAGGSGAAPPMAISCVDNIGGRAEATDLSEV